MGTKLCRKLKGDIRIEFSGMEIEDLMYKSHTQRKQNKAGESIYVSNHSFL